MPGPQRGDMASRRLREGFAKASRKLPIVSSKTGPETHSALPAVFRNHPSSLSWLLTLNINLWHATGMKAHNTIAMKAHNTLQPRSGFAKWLRLCQSYWATRIGFAGLRGTQCIAQVPSRTFWEFPTKLTSVIRGSVVHRTWK